MRSDIPRKQHIYETQEFSQHDVKQINAERQTLCRQITQLESETEVIDKDFWTEQMALGKERDAVSQSRDAVSQSRDAVSQSRDVVSQSRNTGCQSCAASCSHTFLDVSREPSPVLVNLSPHCIHSWYALIQAL